MSGVLQNVLVGGGFALGAAVQPGPLQAFLFTRVVAYGWKRTLPACLSPLLSDGPIAVMVLLLLGQLSNLVQQLLRAGGGGLLLYLGWTALRQQRAPAAEQRGGSAPRTLFEAALVNILNPNPYLGWALVLGPSVVAAWRDEPASAVALVLAFYGTMVASLAAFVFSVGAVRLAGDRMQRRLVAASALVLSALGVFLLATAIPRLWRVFILP